MLRPKLGKISRDIFWVATVALRRSNSGGSDITIAFHQGPTLVNLKTALASPLVQHSQLAEKLEDKLKTLLSLYSLTASQRTSIFQSEFREVLFKQYSRYPEVPRGSWPPVVSKTFINVALIETGQPLKSDYSIRGDADDVLAVKRRLSMEIYLVFTKKQRKF